MCVKSYWFDTFKLLNCTLSFFWKLDNFAILRLFLQYSDFLGNIWKRGGQYFDNTHAIFTKI